MGAAKKQNKSYRTRATRSSGRSNLLTSDPLQNTRILDNQLRSLGLYAAPTLGDGNCLFRALSDQYYGSPSRHSEVRREICDFIEAHPERYEGFVDVDEFGESGVRKEKGGGLTAYVAGMRQNATYGGHMELSAFAHLTRRNIKVVQPGLVYVIQCDPQQPKSPKSMDSPSKHTRFSSSKGLDGGGDTATSPQEEYEADGSTIYVAYHDWEHFSSVRSLRGPHTGIPRVREAPAPPTAGSSSSGSPPPDEHLPPSKARKKERERKEKEKKEAGRLKAKEKAASSNAPISSSEKAKAKASQTSAAQSSTGFKLKIPPRALPPPMLSMTAATPISAGASPLSSLPPSPTDEIDDLLDAVTVPLPFSVPPSVATSPPLSHSSSPAPGTGSEQPLSDQDEDSSMNSPSADLSATITLPSHASHQSSGQFSCPTYPHAYAPYGSVSFPTYPYSYSSYPAHLTQGVPGVSSFSFSASTHASCVDSTPDLLQEPSQTSQDTYASSGGYPSTTTHPGSPIYFPTNSSAVAIDPLSHLAHLTHLIPPPRIQRSPKRSFEESEEGSAESGLSTSSSESKRSRMEDLSESDFRGRQETETSPDSAELSVGRTLKDDEEAESTHADDGHHVDEEDEADESQAGAQIHGPDSESSAESNDGDDDYVDEENDEDDDLEPNLNHSVPPKNRRVGHSNERPLTRRERKKLGLPKPRGVNAASGKGAGKIVIPGGKSPKPSSHDATRTTEWAASGIGRVDVRGFRELKI